MKTSVMQTLADAVYTRGYEDQQKGRDYDPRGAKEWQAVVDATERACRGCGGCGEVDGNKRCLGCMHPFTTKEQS